MYSCAASGGKEEGIQMADNEKKEETINQENTGSQGNASGSQERVASGVATEYQFSNNVKLKECKHCRVMVPKKAKICPNCKMSLKKRWLRNFFIILVLLVLIAVVAVGGYYYFYGYQPTSSTSVAVTEQHMEVAEKTVNDETADTVAEDKEVLVNETADETTVNEENEQVATIEADAAESIGMPDAPEASDTEEEIIELTECSVSEEDICGADGPLLDYADENIIIFHDYCGMFVYNMKAEEITASFDLAAIGCQDTQGDTSCIVSVTDDGSIVYLHPSNTQDMYVYDVEKNLLTKKEYSMKDAGEFYEPKITSECVESDVTLFRTYYCADLGKNTYLYLESGSGLIADLCYVIVKNDKQTEYKNLFEKYFGQNTEVSVEKDVKADEETFVEEYQELVNIDALSQISYKDMLRKQDEYKDTEIALEVTVMTQVDGGLFDDNVYYLCVGTDEQGIERYYIIRDDREVEELLILEGDVLRIQGTLFDRCKLPANLVETQPTVPALGMSACELVEE